MAPRAAVVTVAALPVLDCVSVVDAVAASSVGMVGGDEVAASGAAEMGIKEKRCFSLFATMVRTSSKVTLRPRMLRFCNLMVSELEIRC